MITLNQSRTLFIDIDGTLAIWEADETTKDAIEVGIDPEGNTFWALPHFKHLEFIKKVKAQNYATIAWSAAGGEWAAHVIQKLEMEEYVDLCVSKPTFALDDLLDASKIIPEVIWFDPNTGERFSSK